MVFQVIGVAWERETYLSDQVEAFKRHLISHLAPAITERVLDTGVLNGLADAVMIKKGQWTPTTNMTRF